MSKKGLKTMLVCIVLLIGLVTLFACNKGNVADKDGQTKVVVKIQDEDGSIYKENVVFSDLFTLSLQKEGYTGRLYRDADFLKPLTKDSKVKNGDTVYVKWTINSYTVTFMDGKTLLKTEKVQHGSAATAPEVPEQDGKTFKEWDKGFSNVTSDLTINAVYDVDTFTVTFKDGDTVLSIQTVEYGKSATAPTVTPAPGKEHTGWDVAFDRVQNDLVVNATFKDIMYTVKFVADGITRYETKVKYGEKVDAPNAPEVKGKTFERWDGTAEYVTENVTITAIYKLNSYTIKFILNNGEADVVRTQDYGTAITAPTPEMTGYTFDGWDKTVPETMPANDVTITAQWKINKYTITFVLGNGNDDVVLTQDYGTAITAPVPEATAEQSFDGWDKTVPKTMPAEDVTITAQWKTRKYTLTFINYDGTPVHTAEVEYGASIDNHFETADSAATYDDILDYDGWYKADGTRIDELDLPKMPAQNLTLTLKLSLTASAIGDFTVNTPADFTFTESNSAEFTVTPNEGTTLHEGVTYKYIWTINKDNVIYKTEETTVSSLTLQNLAAGKYLATVKIVASMENCGTVEEDFTAGKTLIVSRADILDITVTGGTFTYGDENAKIKIDGLKDGDVVTYGTDGTTFPLQNVDLWALNVGEYGYYVRVDRGDNYNPYTSDKKITVKINEAKVTVVVTPDDDTLTYGNNLPSLTATINGETYTIESGNYELHLGYNTITGSVANNVGTYNIENVDISVLREKYPKKNYNITVETVGTITINQAKLTVTVSLDKTELTYGEALPKISYTFRGLKLSDAESDFTITETEFAEKLDVSTYTAAVTLSGDKTKFYNITVNTVEFKVNKKAATITIEKVNDITYGDKVPALSATVDGVLAGDSLAYTLETNYTVGAKPGNYTARVEFNPEAAENKNYAINTTGRTFNVGTKALEIKLDSNVSVGNVAKTYTVEVGSQDLVIGELATGDVIEGSVSITSSEGGTFVDDKAFQKNIVIKNAAGEVVTAYYEITYNLKVVFVKYDFEINADDKTVTYNGAPQNVDLVTWDASKTYKVMYGTAANECNAESLRELNCINAGTYTIYFKVVDTANGAEEKGSVKFTISPAKVTIKVEDVTITYGETPAYSHTVTGLVEGETLSGEAQYIVEGMTDGNVGTYKVKVGGLSANDNYAITVVPGTLTINQKSIAVVWSTKDKYVYSPDGQEMPAATYDGRSAKVTTNGEFKNAGTYTFTATDESGNYTLTNAVLNVVIEKATYSGIVHDALSGVYNPAKTLKDYALTEGFTWVDASEKPVCTKPEYAAIYNADSDNYENFELNIAIDLQKAEVALKDGVVGFDYDGTSHEIKAVVTYNGVALDTSLYSLTYDGKTSKTYTDAGTHRTLVTMEADNYDLPENTYVYVKVRGVKVGNNYYTIEEALFKSKSGDTVEFISAAKEVSFAPLDIATAIYADNAYRTVKAGVTLKLASDEDSSATIGKPTYGNGVKNYVDTDSSKIKYKLILNESTVLEVYGNILIQGLLGFSGQQGYQGHTSGNHSQIINNGTINLNNGAKLDLRGYIKGTGKIEARSGATVYSPFVVRDFRGGSSSAGTYFSSVSPFNVYEMPNIQCLYGVNYGATHTAYMDLFGGGKHNNVTNNAIASNSAVIILKEGSRLIKTYDRDSEKSTLTIYGNVELGDLSMEVSGATIKMSDVRFPIPWNYTINIGDGIVATSFAVKYDYKIMTGATVNVKKNATVNLTGTVVIYKEFTDQAYAGWVYPNKEPAKFCVEGKVSVNGKLVSKAGIAGEITGLNGGKVIIGKYVNLQLSSKEGHATNILPTSFVKVATISAKAELVNADGKIITAVTNKTYNYNNGTWQ